MESSKFAVACSGGVDSMTTCMAIKQILNLQFTAVIVNHNLRQNSSKEASLVSQYLSSNQIQSVILEIQNPQKTKNIEESARNQRYDLITNYCTLNNISQVILAHHLDDQIETFFLRLERGSGIDGLSSMDYTSIKNGIIFYRPLLSVEKSEIINYALSTNVKWFEDYTNLDTSFSRNKIRKTINDLKITSLQKNRINLAIQNLKLDSQIINKHISNLFKQTVLIEKNQATINITAYKQLLDGERFRLLNTTIQNIAGSVRKERLQDVQKIDAEIIRSEAERQFYTENLPLVNIRIKSNLVTIVVKPKQT